MSENHHVRDRTHKPRAVRRMLDLLHAPITKTHVMVGVLMLVFGFSFAGQFAHRSEDSLEGLSQTDMITLLDELRDSNAKLSEEQTALEEQLRELRSSNRSEAAAREAAQNRADAVAMLAGQVKAEGPGITIRVTDPSHTVSPMALVNLLGELRNAGATAVELSGNRVIASTSITRKGDDLMVGNAKVAPPYRILAIGDPHTLSVALGIPGGAISYLKTFGSDVAVTESSSLQIDSVAPEREFKWAKPNAG